MKIKFVGRKVNLRDSFKERVEKKLAKYDRFFGDDAEATVTVTLQKNRQTVEITVRSRSYIYRAEHTCQDMDEALDIAIEHLAGHIRKNKTRLERTRSEGSIDALILAEPAYEEVEEEEEQEFQIVRSKKYPVTPMEIDEAIMQMNMLEHDFFMFRNSFTGAVNVVYRRKDGNYGLIEPEE
ncbi:MAG: ribosome-associated translation inhibitor RaiA [Ruminococcaceae bacterium]|nr:ribosome-associated translation inhibitor RaiA [Oscillospiraceae bacterium]